MTIRSPLCFRLNIGSPNTRRQFSRVSLGSGICLAALLASWSSAGAQTAGDVATQQQQEAAAEQQVLLKSLVARGLLTQEQADAVNTNANKMQSETARLHGGGAQGATPARVTRSPYIPVTPADAPAAALSVQTHSAQLPPASSQVEAEAIAPPPVRELPPPPAPAKIIAPASVTVPAAVAVDPPIPQRVSGGDTEANRKIAMLSRELEEQRAEAAAQQRHLIDALVARGVLSKAQAGDLSSPSGASPATKTQLVAAAQADQAPVDQYKPVPGAVNVPYVPNYVREQIRDQVRSDLIAEAKAGKVSPVAAAPEWTDRIKISGDIRVRGEYDKYDKNNDPGIVDVNALQGSTYDINTATEKTPLPFLNTLQDRDRVRLRARLNVDAQIDDQWAANFRLTTGNTGTPVTQNQTLGNDFNKDSFVLDRAGIIFSPTPWAKVSAGRIANPFMSTDLIWNNDLSFDGFDAQFNTNISSEVVIFGTIGGFPLQFTDLNAPSNTPAKQDNFNKWLISAQIGADYRPIPSLSVRSAAAIYDFVNYQGEESAPCQLSALGNVLACSTDGTHPGFAQNGNSFFALRQLDFDPTINTTVPHPQYFGLTSKFNVLDLDTKVDWTVSDPLHLVLNLDYAINLGYDINYLRSRQTNSEGFVNNVADLSNPASSQILSGNQAFSVRVNFGVPQINKLFDWNFGVGYKYIEPDAVVAAFNDSDFHLGGTNAQGYILSGSLGVAKNTWFTFNWFSSHEVKGQPYAVDVMQLDLNSRF